jgi:RNA recognition motif-containing protein
MDEEELRELFSKYGPIKNVSIKKKNSVFGFIEFQDSRDAESALKEDGADVSGHKIRVEKSNPRQRDERDSYRRDDYRNSRRSRSRDRRDDRRDDRRPSYRDSRDYQNRDGFRERPSGCFNCKQDGHIAKNCPEPR